MARRPVAGDQLEKSVRDAAFAAAIEECEAYSRATQSAEAKAVALNIAARIQRRAKAMSKKGRAGLPGGAT